MAQPPSAAAEATWLQLANAPLTAPVPSTPSALGAAPATALTALERAALPEGIHLEWLSLFQGKACRFEARQLTPCTLYAFRVRAEGGSGGGRAWSAPLLLRTDAAVPSPPEPPTMLKREQGTIVVEWLAPDCHGQPITHYELQVEPQAGAAPRLFTVPPPPPPREDAYPLPPRTAGGNVGDVRRSGGLPNGAAAVVPRVVASATDLPPACQCLFRVRAVNGVGEGPWSAPARFRTQATAPSPPSCIEACAVGAREATITWASAGPNGSDISEYEVGMTDSEGAVAAAERELAIVLAAERQANRLGASSPSPLGTGASAPPLFPPPAAALSPGGADACED